MSTREIRWGGEPFALLVEGEDGYLVPPTIVSEDDVVDPSGVRLTRGQQVDGTAEVEGEQVRWLVACPTPDFLAEIDQRMAHLSASLGVPIWRKPWTPYDGETQQ